MVLGVTVALREARITHYVEHPVQLVPPHEAPAPAPQPLKLTKREVKKLRTQRRQAREKEKQELIAQGLLEAPKAKVKISNLHRVMAAEGVLDPTAVEMEVRKQMAERLAAHEDRNLARKLTPAEAREKKMRKLFGADGAAAIAEGGGGGGAAEVLAAVYRISSLANPQHKFKVDMNARENHMTGASLVVEGGGFALVVVEGVSKALKRYNKLMLRRIDWTDTAVAGGRGGDDDGGGGDEANDVDPMAPPNRCDLVWQGVVAQRAFHSFKSHAVAHPSAARALLEEAGVPHYWDAAANFLPEAAPPPLF